MFDVHQWIETTWLVIGVVWLLGALRLKPGATVIYSSTRALEIGVLVCAAMLLFSRSPRSPILNTPFLVPGTLTDTLGVALTFAGAVIAIVARLYLAGNWSAMAAVRQGHEIVRNGPYAWVRHPIYSGALLAAVGTAIAFGQVRDLIALPLVSFGFWLKSRSEEQLLLQELGADYATYRREVPSAIVPFLL
jgi:protein-S-isoprenylcysteine O-methyltransferase Ste14